jgi:hypothetical protein
MSTHFRRFFLQNLVLVLLLSLVGVIVFRFVPGANYKNSYPLVLLVSWAVNILVFYLVTRKPVPVNRSMSLLGQTFAIKFLYYLTLAVIFLVNLTAREERISFMLGIFVIYIAFSFLEVKALSCYVKSMQDIS